MSTWFITGCSTGLGRALATAVLDAGHNLVATARDTASLADLVAAHPESCVAPRLDVTDAGQVVAAAQAALDRFDAVDVVVNNAGYGYRAAIEEGDHDDVEQQFATNFFGPLSVIKELLPSMRKRGQGTIINISSISAQVCPPGSGYYAASKAALEAVTSSLRKEVGPLGIRVVLVEPGGFRTDFAGRSLQQVDSPIGDYATTAGQRRKENDTTHGTQPGDPVKAAAAIIRLAETPEPPAFVLLGSDAQRAVRAALDTRLAEIDAWRELSVSTDYAG